MGIFYHFLSTLESANLSYPTHRITHPWLKPTWISPTEQELRYLDHSIIVQTSFFAGALKCALLREIFILFGRSYQEYTSREDKDGTGDASSSEALSLWKPWSWFQWKDSVLPFLSRHLATLWTMEFYRHLASLGCSKLVLLKLSQHPYYKVEYVALRDNSPLSVASRAFVVTVWGSALYYLADLTVRQVSIFFAKYDWSAALIDPKARAKYLESTWAKSTRELLYRQYLRVWYTSFGSAMGSMVWPGFGTLVGTGFGELRANQQDTIYAPKRLLEAFPKLELLPYFASTAASTAEAKQGPTVLQGREFLCGCCQVKYFSSNPSHPTHAPVSSKSCAHTICRACVDLCQVAELNESGAYGVAFSEQLAACPICDTPGAFSPEDLLVNQSLCGVISLLERQQRNTRSSQQPAPLEIDAAKVQKHKRLSWLASMSDGDNSPSQFPSSSEMSSDDEDNALVGDMGEVGVVNEKEHAPSPVASSNTMSGSEDEAVVSDEDVVFDNNDDDDEVDIEEC